MWQIVTLHKDTYLGILT